MTSSCSCTLADRVCSTVTAAQPNGISQFADQHFDDAFNETLIAGDLPHIKWGRIDYINVTYITTKWGIWKYALFSRLHWSSSTH